MKVLITGATGLLGTEIVKLCIEKGYHVNYLTTRKRKIRSEARLRGYYWNPYNKDIDKSCIEGVDMIINLAGASISKRWTATYKSRILSSRTASLKVLYNLVSSTPNQVKQLISASAIGIYPSSLTEKYGEDTLTVNASFLGTVVLTWEQAADEFKNLGLEVTKLRIGVVLSSKGGALEPLIKPVKFGVGSPLGSGKQYQSWIHIDDLTRIFLYVMEQQCSGVYNAVASKPVTNEALTKVLAKQLHRPLWLPKVPAFMLKLILGEMATIVLESQYVLNDKIKSSGFEFEFDTIEHAVKDLLSKN
ncbi:MAG: TIGR01777 family oxidoreductase [Flavobacteriaceae bacterium]|nr:TIGR01777 family oxidoreductase [Flavobacteriaceae bacterium]